MFFNCSLFNFHYFKGGNRREFELQSSTVNHLTVNAVDKDGTSQNSYLSAMHTPTGTRASLNSVEMHTAVNPSLRSSTEDVSAPDSTKFQGDLFILAVLNKTLLILT